MKAKLIWLLVLFILIPCTTLGATCDPLTLEGHIAFVVAKGEKLVVYWQWVKYLEIETLSLAQKKEYARELKEAEEKGYRFIVLHPLKRLEFLRSEVWRPNFEGEQRLRIREITFLELGCRRDGENVYTLLAPPELLFSPQQR